MHCRLRPCTNHERTARKRRHRPADCRHRARNRHPQRPAAHVGAPLRLPAARARRRRRPPVLAGRSGAAETDSPPARPGVSPRQADGHERRPAASPYHRAHAAAPGVRRMPGLTGRAAKPRCASHACLLAPPHAGAGAAPLCLRLLARGQPAGGRCVDPRQ